MPSKTDPLPTPSTDHDLANIQSKDWLLIWDEYVKVIAQGCHSFHGGHTSGVNSMADYIVEVADALMERRQERAQGHIDQGIVEKAKEKAEKARE